MPRSSRKHGHQVCRCVEEPRKPIGSNLNRQTVTQMLLLRRDTDRAVVCMAGTHPNAADSLNGSVGYRYRVCSQRHCLGKVRRMSQSARDDQRHARRIA